jgi:hypothetical protein
VSDMGLQVDPIAAQDPSYLAFMRGAGYSEAEVMAELARKQGGLQRQLERSAPRFADQLRQAGTGVARDFQNRGLYSSGGRMVQQTDAENEVRRAQQDFNFGIRDQQGDLTSQAMRDIASQRQQAADMMLTSRQTAAINAANSQGAGGPVYGHSSYQPPPGTGGTFGAPPPGGPSGRVAPAQMQNYDAFRRHTLLGTGGTRGPRAM